MHYANVEYLSLKGFASCLWRRADFRIQTQHLRGACVNFNATLAVCVACVVCVLSWKPPSVIPLAENLSKQVQVLAHVNGLKSVCELDVCPRVVAVTI